VTVSEDAGPSSGLSLAIYGIFWAKPTHCPIAPHQSARSDGNSHRTLIASADRRDGNCVIVFFQQIGLVIVKTVQFLTHCDQI
jgi:hypothetical protein